MNFSAVDREMKISLTMKLEKLEEYLKGDVMFFFGSITPVQIQKYRFLLEELQVDKKYDTLLHCIVVLLRLFSIQIKIK